MSLEKVQVEFEIEIAESECSEADAERIFEMIEQERAIQEIVPLIESIENFNTVFETQTGYSFLHAACVMNNNELVRYLIDRANRDLGYLERISYVNLVTINPQQEFSALHLACFSSSLKIVKFLIQSGASYDKLNSDGVGMVHMAAQGDQGGTVYYLTRVLDLDVNLQDKQGNSPTHWAVYTCSENALNFIFSDPHLDLDLRDASGNTALHLAIIHYENTKSVKLIKLMLLEGISRSAKNNEGFQASEYVHEILDNPT